MPKDFSDGEPQELILRLGAGSVVMAPRGDLALAQIGDDLYAVTVPDLGAALPTIDVTKPDSAAVPTWKLNQLGVEFPDLGRGRTHGLLVARQRPPSPTIWTRRRAIPSTSPPSSRSR